MLAISPQLCSYGWLLDDPSIHEQENASYFCRERAETSESIDHLHSPNSSKNQPKNGEFDDGSLAGDGDKTVKKLNHNASERDRRKKMNTLYASLRSLLPPEDHSVRIYIINSLSFSLSLLIDNLIYENGVVLAEKTEHSSDSFKSAEIHP